MTRSKKETSKKDGNTKRVGEGQLYDKIIRENLLELFLPLVAEQLNFKVKSVTPLVDKQPTTILRETDSFLLIETYSKVMPRFILHIEFESKDDPEMIYRITEYHGIELRKYRLPIKHVVVYLGEKAPKMRTKLKKEEIFEEFTLVNAHNFSPEEWLSKEEPEKIIMAILGDYKKENAKVILEAIFTKLRKVCKTTKDLQKFIQQLIIISRMRNLEELTIKMSNEMPILIDIEKDYLYKLGLQKSEEKIAAAEEAVAKAIAEKAVAIAEKKIAIAEKEIAIAKAAIIKMQVLKFDHEIIAGILELDNETLANYLKEIEEKKKAKS